MNGYQLTGLLLTIVAGFGYLNRRILKLPDIVGITAVAMAMSIALMVAARFHAMPLLDEAQDFVRQMNFDSLVFDGMLGLLLFAGALHVDVSAMKEQKWPIVMLSTFGVLLSMVIAGYGMYAAMHLFGAKIDLLWCMAFGALISPTDPVVVLSILKTVGLPKSLEDKITGEALFNDGVAVVAFTTLVGMASGSESYASVSAVVHLLAHEVLLALVLGLLFGFLGTRMVNRVDSHAVEIFITLSMATAGYSLAVSLGASGPLTAVVMGLVVGSHGFNFCVSEKSRERLFDFWSLVDELLNFILFGLVGLMVLTIDIGAAHIAVGAVAILIVLFARYVSVGIPLGFFRSGPVSTRARAKILTWGGLRGGISIALALSLPAFAGRGYVQAATYIVVAFGLMVQATTLNRLVTHWLHGKSAQMAPAKREPAFTEE